MVRGRHLVRILDEAISFSFLSHFGQSAKTAQNSKSFGAKIDNVEPILYYSCPVHTALHTGNSVKTPPTVVDFISLLGHSNLKTIPKKHVNSVQKFKNCNFQYFVS